MQSEPGACVVDCRFSVGVEARRNRPLDAAGVEPPREAAQIALGCGSDAAEDIEHGATTPTAIHEWRTREDKSGHWRLEAAL
jgi:hypothetical protein